jgi:hypothetical protein
MLLRTNKHEIVNNLLNMSKDTGQFFKDIYNILDYESDTLPIYKRGDNVKVYKFLLQHDYIDIYSVPANYIKLFVAEYGIDDNKLPDVKIDNTKPYMFYKYKAIAHKKTARIELQKYIYVDDILDIIEKYIID